MPLTMDLLTFSQILFNFVGSIAFIVLGVLLTLSIYYFLKTAKNISEIVEKINSASDDIKNKIVSFFEKLSNLSFLSFLNRKKESHKKGRKST